MVGYGILKGVRGYLKTLYRGYVQQRGGETPTCGWWRGWHIYQPPAEGGEEEGRCVLCSCRSVEGWRPDRGVFEKVGEKAGQRGVDVRVGGLEG